MNLKAVLAAVLLAVMAGAWWWTLSGPSTLTGTTAVSRASAPPRPASHEPPPAVALDRLRQATLARAPVTRSRDPFGTGTAVGMHGPVSERPTAEAVADGPGASNPRWPRLELIGIAEQTSDGAATRVAILASTRGVHHASTGDIVEDVYRVERVGVDAVDVRLVPDDRVLRFALR